MIRLLLMALGAYTLYRIYAPFGPEEKSQAIIADRRSDDKSPGATRGGGTLS